MTPGLAYCLYAESARHTGTDWSRNYVSYPKKGEVRRLMPSECEGVMAFPSGWTVPDKIEWDEETYDTLRYHALGNAITPPVAEWLGTRVKEYLDASVRLRHDQVNGDGAALLVEGDECGSLSRSQVAEASMS